MKIIKTVKTVTPELEKLKVDFANMKDSPWSHYVNIGWSEVIETFNQKGYDEAKELIRRADIVAYRRDEADCGCI